LGDGLARVLDLRDSDVEARRLRLVETEMGAETGPKICRGFTHVYP
jgi:hypothetical protein